VGETCVREFTVFQDASAKPRYATTNRWADPARYRSIHRQLAVSFARARFLCSIDLIGFCIANDHPTRTAPLGPGLLLAALRSLARQGQ